MKNALVQWSNKLVLLAVFASSSFHSFSFFFSLIHFFEPALLMHTSFNVFSCVWYCTRNFPVEAQVDCHGLCPLTCVLGAGHWSYQGQDGEKSKVWLRNTYIFQISLLAGWLTQFPSIYIFHICFGLFLLSQKEVERKSAQENKYGEVILK